MCVGWTKEEECGDGGYHSSATFSTLHVHLPKLRTPHSNNSTVFVFLESDDAHTLQHTTEACVKFHPSALQICTHASRYSNVYTHTHTYTHRRISAYVHTCIHTNMYAHKHAYTHINMQTNTHMNTHMLAFTCQYIHNDMHACMNTHIIPYMHACIHACTYTYMHACTYTDMHACTYTCSVRFSFQHSSSHSSSPLPLSPSGAEWS